MQRLNIKELINIDYDFVNDGTSAMYLATNPYNNKTGILKKNGCMLGVTNEDLREKLASTIINMCGIDTALIELCIDDNGTKYALSYNVLKENQKHIELSPVIIKSTIKEEIWKEYIRKISASIMCLPQINLEQYLNIRKRILELHFMDVIIDHYDRKVDNNKIIYDENTKQYLPTIGYDYGIAFCPNKTNGIFNFLTNEEVMHFLIKFHYNDLEFLIKNTRTTLNENTLNLILSQEQYQALDTNEIHNQLRRRLNQLDSILMGQSIETTIEQQKTI